MQAGRLTDIIKIYRPVVARNEYGEQVTTYTPITEERASVRYGNIGRGVVNQAVAYGEQFEFIVYHYVDAQNYDVVEYQGERYNVQHRIEERTANIKKLMCIKIYE